jgi:hypothetical protein
MLCCVLSHATIRHLKTIMREKAIPDAKTGNEKESTGIQQCV